jgi:hypothetical protein
MVASLLNDKITYDESSNIKKDVLHKAYAIYEMPLHGKDIEFAVGQADYIYTDKNVIFYPIYLVHEDKIKAQIGVYEIDTNAAITVLDKEGDIDLDMFSDPLLFSFVTEKFIQKATAKSAVVQNPVEHQEDVDSDDEYLSTKMVAPDQSVESINMDDIEADETEKALTLKPRAKDDKKSVIELSAKDVFERSAHGKMPAILKEETDADAETEKKAFKKSSKNLWIENYMKNNHYGIVETEMNGDCFFGMVREAYSQIGHATTVEKLRALVAQELTDTIFQEHLSLFQGFQHEIDELDKELESMKATNALYAKRMRKTMEKVVRDELISEALKLKAQYKAAVTERKAKEALQTEYVGYMRNIKTLEQFRAYIKTSGFWADTWTISTLERLLNVKFIIMSEQEYDNGSMASVLNCGEVNSAISERGIFSPEFYIIATYSGDHYRLITYKHKRIFTFREIPYGLKILIIKKCMERNSGVYWLIQEFRNMKAALGIDPDVGKPVENDDEPIDDLCDSDVVFVFGEKASGVAKPGKASGEKIAKSKIPDYVDLAKNKDWRRKLDDRWTGMVMTIDSAKWASVEHYMQAAKYKKGFPDFAALFCIDSGNKIGTDVKMAIAAGEDDGKHGKKVLRPANVSADADFALGRKEEERKIALAAKFSQNEDLKQILMATHRAQLSKFVDSDEAVVDVPLMRLRSQN